MNEEEWEKARTEFDEALQSGSINNATPRELHRWLVALNSGTIPNTMVHPREIIKGITINYILIERALVQFEDTMKKMDAANQKTQRLVIILAIIAIIVGAIQAVASVVPLLK